MDSLTIEINGLNERLKKLDEYIKTKDLELSTIQISNTEEMNNLKKRFDEQVEEKNKSILEITADVTQKSSRLAGLEKELNDLKHLVINKDEEIKNLSDKILGNVVFF